MSRSWVIRKARDDDDTAIRSLLKATAQHGAVSLSFERESSYFYAVSVTYSNPEIYVYEDQVEQRIVGMFNAGLRDVYINGLPKKVRYTGELRIHPDYQGSRVMFRLAKKLKSIMGDESWAHTVILSDNEQSLKTVSKSRGGMPDYHHHAQLLTHTLFPQRKLSLKSNNNVYQVRRAEDKDISMMQVFFNKEAVKKQFYPCYDFSKLSSDKNFYRGLDISNFYLAMDGDDLVGILGVWNQEGFKQTRVVAYRGYFHLFRYFYNLYSNLFGGFEMPSKGECLSYCYTHTLVVDDNNPLILRCLLNAIGGRPEYRKLPLVVGLDSQDPLNEAVYGLKRHTLASEHFLSSYSGDPKRVLDKGIPYIYPEVARL